MLRVCVMVLCVAFLPASTHAMTPPLPSGCDENIYLNDTSGEVVFDNSTHVCWHIACDKDVAITFAPGTQIAYYSTLSLLDLRNGADYTQVYEFWNDNGGRSIPGPEPYGLHGTAIVRSSSRWTGGVAKFSFDYLCVDTTIAPTEVPGINSLCGEDIDLNDTSGKVAYVADNNDVVCWHIECDKAVVFTFAPNFSFPMGVNLTLYGSSNGVDYTQEYTFWKNWYNEIKYPGSEPYPVHGPAYVRLMRWGIPTFSFEYVCVDHSTPAPATPAPATPAPATAAPPTLTPGLDYICATYTTLNNATLGNVTVVGSTNDAECWHMECDKEVVFTLFTADLKFINEEASLVLLNSVDGGNYSVQADWSYWYHPSLYKKVLQGSMYLQLLNGLSSSFTFEAVCVDSTPAPATSTPTLVPTRAPGVDRICEKYTALNDTAGHVSAQNTNTTVCWHIECDKSVVITFTSFRLHDATLDMYSKASHDADYSLYHVLYEFPEGPIVLQGSALLQLSNPYSYTQIFELDYVCLSETPAPATEAPPTLAPGVDRICDEYTALNDTAGHVSAQDTNTTVCWHIECDKSVVITFTYFRLNYATLDMYSKASHDVNYSLYHVLYEFPEGPIVLQGSALLQLSNPYSYTQIFGLDYVCLSETPQPTTDAPPTLAPGVQHMCQERTDLNDTAGKVEIVNSTGISVECWYIECDKFVMITFTTLSFENRTFLELFNSESENGTKQYTLERTISYSDNTGVDYMLTGSALVQLQMSDDFSENNASKVGFNYKCMADTPPPLAPGVQYTCQDLTDLSDASGTVTYANQEANSTACWRIACDKSVAITFSSMEVYTQSLVYLYSSGSTSGSATHYTLDKVLFSSASTGVELMLDGSALVQFRSGTHAGMSAFDFEYVCKSADKDDSGHPTWPYVVFPVVGVLFLALGVVALLKSGVCKAKVSKDPLQEGINDEGAPNAELQGFLSPME